MTSIFPKEVRLIFYIIGLYVCFIYWGYLQEKLTSAVYKCNNLDGSELKVHWDFPYALNFLMGLGAVILSSLLDILSVDSKNIHFFEFAKAAFTCTLASPLGYAALKYISFPLVILTKSAKPVPLMLIGVLFFKKKYTLVKYLCVGLLCSGCIMFSSGKKGGKDKSSTMSLLEQLYGIFLVGVNLFLDGYTNNEQDRIFKVSKISGTQMMKYINIWQCIYLLIYLVVFWMIWGDTSELYGAVRAIVLCREIQYDIVLFCICASGGQVLIFALMQEFGSLTWITVSVTRKLFTVLISVFAFNHLVTPIQWLGVVFVFAGLGIDIIVAEWNKFHGIGGSEKSVDSAKVRKQE